MDIKETFGSIKEGFSSIFQSISDFFKENRKTALVILGAAVLILVLLIVLIFSIAAGKKSPKVTVPEKAVILTEQLLVPDGPEIVSEYEISRKARSRWSDAEADEWFTEPSEADLQNLSKSNDNLINDILGAAP